MSSLLLLTALLGAPTAIVGARIELGDGHVIERGNVVFDEGGIRAVGDAAAIPKDTVRIDGTGRVLSPGFIETQSQLGLIEVELEASTQDFELAKTPLAPGFRAMDGFNPRSVRIALAREEGVTSVVSSPRGGILAGTGAWIDLASASTLLGQRLDPIAMFGAVGSRAAEQAGGARGGVWLMLRELFDDARDYRAHASAYARGESRRRSLAPLHLAAMQPVLDGTLPLVLEAERASDILEALKFSREQKVRVVIAGGAEAWVVAPALAEAKVAVVVRPSMQSPASFEQLGARDDVATLLDAAGVPVIVSAWDWDQNIRRLRQEAGMAVAFGLSHAKAVAAITSVPARTFGKASRLGSVAPGRRANLVLWSGDPLELTSIAEHVWIDGRPVSLETRQRALARRYLER